MTIASCGTPVDLVRKVDGKEASFTIEPKVVVDGRISSGKKILFEGPQRFKQCIKRVAEKVLKSFEPDCGARLKCVDAKNFGLPGELEACCVSTTLSLVADIAKNFGSINALKVDKYLHDQFFIVNDRVVNKDFLLDLCLVKGLSYGKVASCFYGGFVVSEGERVLRGGEMEDLYAAVVKIKEKSRAMSDKLLNGEMEIVWEEAYKGNLYSSMNMSSLIVSTAKSHDLIQKALSHGILAVSAEDDFLVFLTRSKKDRANTLRKTCVSGVKYFANTLNEGVRVLEKPRRVYKVNEFLTLDGSEGYKIFSD